MAQPTTLDEKARCGLVEHLVLRRATETGWLSLGAIDVDRSGLSGSTIVVGPARISHAYNTVRA
jgi:hypothetical protein